MAESRVDDLVKKQKQLNNALNNLSYAEYSEFCTKMGYPLPDMEVERVEPPPQKRKLVLVSEEPGGTDRRAELADFVREKFGNEDMSSTMEFWAWGVTRSAHERQRVEPISRTFKKSWIIPT